MPPRRQVKKAAGPKKTIKKAAAKKSPPKEVPVKVSAGDVVLIAKKGVVLNAVCRKYQDQNGIVVGYNAEEIQVMFMCNDKYTMPFLPRECCTVLNKKKKEKFWKDFGDAVEFAKAQNPTMIEALLIEHYKA